MHGLPNKIGTVKNAPGYDSARCEIRVCAHAVLKCTDLKSVGLKMHRTMIVQKWEIRVCAHAVSKCMDYPIKSVGLRMHRIMTVQGARVGFARMPY